MINDMSDHPWAIMVCIDVKEDDWIFVTEDTGSCDMWNLKPLLFDDINVALEYANGFARESKEKYVKVVSYNV